MAQLFANNVNMQLASNLGATDTSMTVTAGQGSQCPAIAAADANFMLLTLTDKNGNKEIVKVIEHISGSDVFTFGSDESVPHSASVTGRAYEATYDGYQSALAITASDSHTIRMPVTAATMTAAIEFASVTSTVAELGLLDADNRTVGDLITETAAGTMGVIAAVAAGKFLKSNGTATLPSYEYASIVGSIKFGTFTLTTTGATVVSDVGFNPAVVLFLFADSTAEGGGVGFDDGTTHYCFYSLIGKHYVHATRSIYVDTGTPDLAAYISAKDASGFTVTAAATSTISVTCNYLAIR